MNTYSPELKAQVIAEWMAGASLKQLALSYAVPKSTVQEWVKGHGRVAVVPKNKEDDDRDLDSRAWGLVDGSFSALSRIHGVTQDDAWLKRQNAADLAIFAGVISDKLIRLLGAVQRPDSSADQAEVTSRVGAAG